MKRLELCGSALPLLLSVGLMCHVQAHANIIDQTQDDRRLQLSDTNSAPPPSPAQPAIPTDTQVINIDESTLLNSPELLARAMLSALVYNNIDGVRTLLPIYQKQPKDLIEYPMIVWANAVLSTQNQEHKTAIKLYKDLKNNYPDNRLFAARLAQSLFANRQYKEARNIITSDPILTQQLSLYLTAIDNFTKTDVRAGGNLIIDKNINNAPKNRNLGGGWSANAPISAHGIAFNAGLSKRFLFDEGVSISPDVSVRGKLYRDAKQYNEVSLRSSLNTSFRDAKRSLSVVPFHELTYYAGAKKENTELKYFSDSVGVRLAGSTLLGADSQFSASAEFAKNKYQTRKHLDGYSISLSPSFSTKSQILGNAWLSIGSDYQYTKTRDKDDSYRRIGLTGSISKQWKNLGVSANVGIANRHYLAPMPIFNKIQINKEYNAGISLWHDKFKYKGLMPRLTWQYQKTDSTIPLHNYDKSRVFVELSGDF